MVIQTITTAVTNLYPARVVAQRYHESYEAIELLYATMPANTRMVKLKPLDMTKWAITMGYLAGTG